MAAKIVGRYLGMTKDSPEHSRGFSKHGRVIPIIGVVHRNCVLYLQTTKEIREAMVSERWGIYEPYERELGLLDPNRSFRYWRICGRFIKGRSGGLLTQPDLDVE